MTSLNEHTKNILENAAAAVDLKIKYWMGDYPMVLPESECGPNEPHPFTWCPHTNDGDAFRLMVQLGLQIDAAALAGTTQTMLAEARRVICEQAARIGLDKRNAA